MSDPHQERVVYLSPICVSLQRAQLRLVLGHADVMARRQDITGVLSHTAVAFIAVLEGETQALGEFLAALAHCRYHGTPDVLLRLQIQQRLFDHWTAIELEYERLVEEVDTVRVNERDLRAVEKLMACLIQAGDVYPQGAHAARHRAAIN